jgi:CheY-like chemotaxis protein
MLRNRDIEGTGLGLAITKRLCTAMGGDISVTSKYGAGSAFTAIVPQKIGAEVPFARVDNPTEKKVLVYEGRMVYAQSISWSLENLGVPHRLTSDIETFKEALRTEKWYYIFSGYGLYTKIRAAMEETGQQPGQLPGQKPHLALLVEWGTESLIPGARFVSLPVQALSIADVLNGTADRRGYTDNAGMETRFIAPDARLLIVDDMATNLKVAEGLLTPYRTTVETCLSGAEAIELIKRNKYDIVFMDHMMPEMDGVETTAIIREWETEAKKPRLPVIALTANAVSGMREMFLSQGFSDFLAKPIDISKLDEIMGKWLPRDKRQKADIKWGDAPHAPGTATVDSPAAPEDRTVTLPSLLLVTGLDIKRGIALTGGTADGYRQVLSMFQKDAVERLKLLQNPPDTEALPAFITTVHALKSASASIGAADLSTEAARLEAAGKTGDLAFIAETLPGFARRLGELTDGIRAALNENAPPPERAAVPSADYRPLLAELAGALQTQKAETIERILEALARQPLDSNTRAALETISDNVLLAEFGKAAENLSALMAADKEER